MQPAPSPSATSSRAMAAPRAAPRGGGDCGLGRCHDGAPSWIARSPGARTVAANRGHFGSRAPVPTPACGGTQFHRGMAHGSPPGFTRAMSPEHRVRLRSSRTRRYTTVHPHTVSFVGIGAQRPARPGTGDRRRVPGPARVAGNRERPGCFSRSRLKHLVFRNRIMSTSHASGLAEGGMPAERYQRYHEAKARGGIALTMFGRARRTSPPTPSGTSRRSTCTTSASSGTCGRFSRAHPRPRCAPDVPGHARGRPGRALRRSTARADRALSRARDAAPGVRAGDGRARHRAGRLRLRARARRGAAKAGWTASRP